MTTNEALRKARKLIAQPKRWTKGQFRRYNFTTMDYSFCAVGALREVVVAGAKNEWEMVRLIDQTSDKLRECIPPEMSPPLGVTVYNDSPSTTHEDIMALFDCAIEKTE